MGSNPNPNVKFPKTWQKTELTDSSDENKVCFMFTKIDPTRGEWVGPGGYIELDILVSDASNPNTNLPIEEEKKEESDDEFQSIE